MYNIHVKQSVATFNVTLKCWINSQVTMLYTWIKCIVTSVTMTPLPMKVSSRVWN